MSTILMWHLQQVETYILLVFVAGLMLGRKTVRRRRDG